ncbi:MAG: chemotaxis protein CheV [Planctomycetes bacterium]|nr:chemotaxis protein CheV [Planctomycetota bacterium]
MADHDILLESGTNEVEVAELILGNQHFGVNVVKIKEFVQYDRLTVTRPPGRHPSVQGIFLLRGKTVPLIDLNAHLAIKGEKQPGKRIVLITEFNSIVMGFVIDAVDRIHRVSWKDIQPLSVMLQAHPLPVTGSINIKGTEIMMLDLELIVGEIVPSAGFGAPVNDPKITESRIKESRASAKLFFAEDSTTIRSHVTKALAAAGYIHVTAFENGQSAYDAIVALQKQAEVEGRTITDFISLAILDIEMPQMDGLTLCKRIKMDLGLTNVPVIIFSSLITEQMALKCEKMGADGYTTKPSMEHLIEMIDKYCFKKG